MRPKGAEESPQAIPLMPLRCPPQVLSELTGEALAQALPRETSAAVPRELGATAPRERELPLALVVWALSARHRDTPRSFARLSFTRSLYLLSRPSERAMHIS